MSQKDNKSKDKKLTKPTKLNMNTFKNISKIILLTGLTIVLLIIIKDINLDAAKDSLGVSNKSIKITIYLIILVSYISLIIMPVKDMLNYNIKNKEMPVGDKGSRGNRGKSGKQASCDICSDDICDRKILFNITNTYNYWRKLNNLPLYPDSYIIPNNFLKDKIRKHCKSKQFSKLLTKFGSNTQCPNNISDIGINKCGSYDYLNKLWSIWILIILKYKNGAYFLESDSLTDNDFAGLIDKEDSYQIGDSIKYVGYNQPFQVIDNKNFPFFKISNTILDAYEKDMSLDTPNVSYSNDWDDMFTIDANNNRGINNIIINKNKNKDNEVVYSASGINNAFFSKKGVPNRGQMSPFDEIKKYKGWYWGRDTITQPKIIINKTEITPFCRACYNGADCSLYSNGTAKIKVIETNSFYHLWKSSNARQETDPFKPFQPLGTVANTTDPHESINIIRPYEYIDENEHGYFKRYKPVGDILVTQSEMEDIPQDGPCLPTDINNSINYQGRKIKRIAVQSVKSILVSGDTQPPKSYTNITHMLRNTAINKYSKGFSIWKPIPPPGYIALGYVISTLPSASPSPPSLDLIACVPRDSVTAIGSRDNSIIQIYNLNKDLNNHPINPSINIFRNNNIYTFTDTNRNHKYINTSNNSTICKTYQQIQNENTQCRDLNSISNKSEKEKICNNTPGCEYKDNKCKEYIKASSQFNDSIKDRKYSILKIYDTDDE